MHEAKVMNNYVRMQEHPIKPHTITKQTYVIQANNKHKLANQSKLTPIDGVQIKPLN